MSAVVAAGLLLGCGDDSDDGRADELGGSDEVGESSSSTDAGTDESGSSDSSSEDTTDADSSSEDTTDADSSSEDTTDTEDTSSETGDPDCQPDPEICEPGTVCDVITGDCVDPEDECVLAGGSTPCGAYQCGPGTVCDDQGSCIPVAPCGQVLCEGSQCWGTGCPCERPISCSTASEEDLNGPFSVEIFDLEFADDCTAWMVTLRSGTDFVRRLTPEGTVTEWPGVANLNMGEVKVLKALNPQSYAPPVADDVQAPGSGQPPQTHGGENLGQVAITYTCCPTCGCFVDPPQGVARLLEGEPEPLPIVLPAVATQGTNGPFGSTAADAGPMGLTWGEDLQLYVGNTMANGDFDTVDLLAQTQQTLDQFDNRVTAAAPLTAVHLLIALDTGELLRFNTDLHTSTPVIDLEVGVTTLSHDSYTGKVYASLADLSVVEVDPFTGEVEPFETMPAIGRVTVSPDGKLWWVPVGYLNALPLSSWDLPTTF
ncbi:hypothetical protein PPSIR1_28068 [Plesiocystis pacifica SIR-1]|uniref:Uncharacterized protein n=1 Tax=Plesiocystis pacifica SIR-1 TaxID=391625 RepID=A6FZN6_9BACT|nr:hypothetical protein PPSIR1_28068 [Plesiocystis pacifica SIR-1]